MDLTGTCPLMMTSSAKRTLTGFDFSLAFLAALIKADLGDWDENGRKNSDITLVHYCALLYVIVQIESKYTPNTNELHNI